MTKRYHIHELLEDYNTAGYKAPADIHAILTRLGYESLDMHRFPEKAGHDDRLWHRYSAEWDSLRTRVAEGSLLVIQHPFRNRDEYREQMLSELKEKAVKFIYFIHDVEEVRQIGYREEWNAETEFMLANADVMIVHNDVMKRYFMDKGVPAERLISLQIFDYLTETDKVKARRYSKDVIVAGNLNGEKNPHLNELNKISGIVFHLFGPWYGGGSDENVIYHGSLKSDVLMEALPDGFGLVWGGDSLDTCSGAAGDYLRYNDPHKLSLYLASGLPVIAWRNAAISAFVENNHVGILIDSLHELRERLDGIEIPEYEEYVLNSRKMAERLRGGYYTKKAMYDAENMLLSETGVEK